ncbi:MAG: PEP-utilizing enzyme [Microthrixaceae bacterium]
MTDGFTPPGPGTWLLDKSHMPAPTSTVLAGQVDGIARGFNETFARYGALAVSMTPRMVNHWFYMRLLALGEEGDDGAPSPEDVERGFGERIGLAAAAFDTKLWRSDLARFDDVDKPAAIARHCELWQVDRSSLDDTALAAHLEECADHHMAMLTLHHRNNLAAMVPVGDFLAHAAGWCGRPPDALMAVLAGSSPISGSRDDEISAAADAVAADPDARALVAGTDAAAKRLEQLRARVPEVAAWLDQVEFRLAYGFDPATPTLIETPELLLGRLNAAIADARRGDPTALEATLREAVPPEDRATFDELLAEARLVYRLRDERGIYGDISAGGIFRHALLAAGERLAARGQLTDPNHVFDGTVPELVGLLKGASAPTASELADRHQRRLAAALLDAPPFLGPPPHDPPPADQLPPPLARLMTAVGISIGAILQGLPEPAGDDATIKGIMGAPGVYEGVVRVVESLETLLDLREGEVLVSPMTTEAFNAAIHIPGAIVTDFGGAASHAAIVSREAGIPAVVGTLVATKRLRDGMRIAVDGDAGEVRILA